MAEAAVGAAAHHRPELAEDLLRVRESELAVVCRAERADPRIEHLHGVDSGVDLGGEVVADGKAVLRGNGDAANGCTGSIKTTVADVSAVSANSYQIGEAVYVSGSNFPAGAQ